MLLRDPERLLRLLTNPQRPVQLVLAGKAHFEVQVYIGGITPDAVRVELYAEESGGQNPFRLEMLYNRELVGAEHGYVYAVKTAATRPVADFTARIIPHQPGVSVPLEENHILWQH